MPKTIKLYRVFLASPSDVASERETVNEVINEINLLSKDFKLELIAWETHTYPSIGEDGQDVINTQINDDYDIFIGIFWKKIGTPTKRAESGTVEEFERAYSKFEKNPDDLKLLFYFKNAPISISEISPEQIGKIKLFKKDLQEKGLLYWNFNSNEEFKVFIRRHLEQHLDSIDFKAPDLVKEISDKEKKVDYSEEVVDDVGLLDLLLESDKGIDELMEIGLKFQKVYSKFNQDISPITQALSSGTGFSRKEYKSLFDKAGKLINILTSELMELNEPFKNKSTMTYDSLAKSIEIIREFETDQLDLIIDISSNVSGFKDVLKSNLEGFKDNLHNLERLPRVTTIFNQARKKSVIRLKQTITEFEKAIQGFEILESELFLYILGLGN